MRKPVQKALPVRRHRRRARTAPSRRTRPRRRPAARAPAPNGPAKPAAPAPAAPAAAPAQPDAPGQPRPYKDVRKDAKGDSRYFTLHQKDEKVWIELKPDQFDKPFFFSANIPRSSATDALRRADGTRLFRLALRRSHMAKWKKIGNQVSSSR